MGELPPDIRQEKIERFYKDAKNSAGFIFDKNEPENRVTELKTLVEPYFSVSPNLDKEKLFAALDELNGVTDRDVFVQKAFDILLPVTNTKFQYPREFEALQREQHYERNPSFIKINQLLSVDKEDEVLNLHVPPNETTPLRDKIQMLTEGMKQIAELVQHDQSIKEVRGTSWIITQNPGLIEKLGFTVDDISKESGEAHISREDLLKKYLPIS